MWAGSYQIPYEEAAPPAEPPVDELVAARQAGILQPVQMPTSVVAY